MHRLLLAAAALLLLSCGGTEEAPDDPAGNGCEPTCGSRVCGDDGCGGSCGTCADGTSCDEAGLCAETGCTPACGARTCGDDGCGGSCGSCEDGASCSAEGACVAAGPSFTETVLPIFRANCTICHAGSRASAGLDLTSADDLLNTAASCGDRALVVPGDPEASYLVAKITGVGLCSGTRMPSGGRPALGSADMDAIRSWIAGGASAD